ncbi:uncharacterized protein LOC135076738 [Ostrinia nubilalis]|uniref:uncharacterized protein LOC135076738 n=1 Tax=Ostrinia nubilalis TaxID=29057 RepID=UPI00308254C3
MSDSPFPEMFKDLTWRFENATTVRVSWNAAPAKYSVSYSSELNVPVEMWDSIDTVGNTALITDIDPTRDTYVMVTSYDPHVYSPIKTIPAQISEARDLQSSFTRSGVEVRWAGGGPRVVRYSQNLTHSLDLWPSLNATGSSIEITNLDPSLPTYVMVAAPGQSQRSQVLTVPSRPVEPPSLFLGMGIGVGVCLLLILAAAAVCIWRKRKRAGTPLRARRRHSSANDDDDEEAAEMKTVGGRLANGGGSKDAGEPLLNGHVHITENPQTKTPNGNMKKGRMPFDLSRLEDPDSTLETVLDADASALTLDLLDTSRPPERPPEWPPERPPEWPPERPPAPEESFAKLPDDNMNSELTRSAFHTDNSKIQPTLQPNG